MTMSDHASPASNIETIINSIIYDPQVYFWFTLLLRQRPVREELIVLDDSLASDYLKYQRLQGARLVLMLVSGSSFLFFLMSNHYLILFTALACVVGLIISTRRQKHIIIYLSRRLLLNTFPGDSITCKTLYQVAESYSRIYQIPSMVDVVYQWDCVLRQAAAVAVIIFIAAIGSFSHTGVAIFFLMTWIIANMIVRLPITYK
jgi:hypothetical protein